MTERILVLDNLRSAHNVGVILRTADGAGWPTVYLCGTTPSPHLAGDPRPPYAQDRAAKEIAKTALGAEKVLNLHYSFATAEAIKGLKTAGFQIVALEQTANSRSLKGITAPQIALVVGNEVEGISREILELCDQIAEIPMRGQKESLNVAVATGIALYSLMLEN